MRAGALEECSRLLDAALAGSQLAQPREAVGRHARAHRLQVGDRGDQLGLGGRPLAAAVEHLPVGAAADAEQVAAVQALADRPHRLAPLGDPGEVADPFADGDEDAQRPCGRDRELELLAGGHGRGLVQPPHALVDLALDDQRRALDRDAQRLEVGDAELGAQRRRFARPWLSGRLGIGVDLERVVALDDQQPAVLGGRREPSSSDRPRSSQPAATASSPRKCRASLASHPAIRAAPPTSPAAR